MLRPARRWKRSRLCWPGIRASTTHAEDSKTALRLGHGQPVETTGAGNQVTQNRGASANVARRPDAERRCPPLGSHLD